MQKSDLEYVSMQLLLQPYKNKGLPESAAFLNWFLENIFRLDDVAAQDAICDKNNDKGIDGIYVDDFAEEIVFFQAKIKQSTASTIGDVALKEFNGSLSQFRSVSSIESIMAGNANKELKNIISSQSVIQKISAGYDVVGAFLCNMDQDDNTSQYLASHQNIRLYDRERICSEFIDLELDSGIGGTFVFTCDVQPLEFIVDSLAKMYLFPANGSELVRLPGISDQMLFSQNVRLSLGNTEVNREIVLSLKKPEEHKKFPLYHNGITMLCNRATYDEEKLSVSDYVVVNGAQSLSALYKTRKELTSDLRILLRVIEISENEDLSKQITKISNTQNAIKPRDMRSNHQIQIRIKKEFEYLNYKNFVFEIKRGEAHEGKIVISNEDAGRLLLAFDLKEPFNCHQIYKVFDEYYSRIFGRPEVSAKRIIFMYLVMNEVKTHLGEIENKPLSGYTLTRYFLLDVIAHIIRKDATSAEFARDPTTLLQNEEKQKKIS